MSLATALNIAQNALAATSRQTGTVSRNIAGASDPDYNRRIAVLSSEAPGVRAAETRRAADAMLLRQNLGAIAAGSGQAAVAEGMERLALGVNGVDGATSPTAALAKLSEALQTFSATPSNRTLAENALGAASDLARTLNAGAAAVSASRAETDAGIAAGVNDLRNLLSNFEEANREVVAATRGNRDASDALDRRDGLLKKIANLLPVSTVSRADNDMVIATGDGAILFETVPRTVAFSPSGALSPGAAGSPILVDGVPLTTGPDASGKLAGLLYLRDTVGVTAGAQLDEVARSVIAAFAETDQSGAGLASRAGLLTWSGGPALPPAGAVSNGLAGQIKVNALFDSAPGGSPLRLRDGGANGTAYLANTAGAASFSKLLIAYTARLDQPLAADGAARLGTQASANGLAAGAVGWLDGVRQSASEKAETKQALAQRTAEALSNATGVNVDTEYSLLLDLEHAYQASARIIKTVDEMLAALMNAVG